MKKRILVVEDDPAMARVLRDNLTFDGFDVDCAADGATAITHARTSVPDLVLLDLMLPDVSGLDVCGVLRQTGRVPIIMVTARGQKADKLHGFDAGADDYITKPFDLEELLARVHTVLRRSRPVIERLILGKVIIDFSTQRATKAGRPLHLTHREFEMLQYLAERRRVVHRDELLHEVWGYPELPYSRAVDHAVMRLRRKIEADARDPKFIHTAHGDGYWLTPGG
jgi:DNA-binding response OmpR family regulator